MTFTALFDTLGEAWRARLDPVTHRCRAAWQQRTVREQRLLRGGALVLVAALIWAAWLDPAIQTIRYARTQLPTLQAQAAQLDAIVLEAQALGRGRSGTLSAAETERALQESLRSANLDGVSVLSRADGATTREQPWQVQFTNAPAGRVMEWMANLPFVAQLQTRRVELARSNVDGRDRPGQLSGGVVLALAQQEEK